MKKLIAGAVLGLTAFVSVTAPAQAGTSPVGAATGRTGGAPAAGGPVTASHFDCSGHEDGNYPDPNDSSGYIACVAKKYAYAMSCAQDTDGRLLFYVAGSGPDPTKSRCDYRYLTRVTPTLTAGTLRAQDTGAATALTATMTLDGEPVTAARITFTDNKGRQLCETYTDSQGAAACATLPGPSSSTFAAMFAGGSADPEKDGGWQTAEATGTLT
ncbi:chitin binding peritrophin-A domain-containing protein [Streptomyces sp. SID3343]|uniref:chitin binding peritrophin-A domain-containing protein n=1 Tax=Streptomyces sp. SID3343 TaxID=2690260 RepID=UPI001369F1B1|nr:chitin binding peritrophin-A domain-containing protein [Streptomyces sp. SID3343]